nr:Gag-Pol polyprotein [Tanacetum cinerariifolium]
MDDPDITMEEYIRIEEEKVHRCGKVYNWETATYGKIWDNKDVHDLGSVETEFPAIVFNDTLISDATLSYEPMELKQIEADDQAIQTILFSLPEEIYAAVDKKIASNLKFLSNLQPEWSRYVTIVHQTKDLHIADYTQMYDFLKYNQKEVDELKAERLAKNQDPLALMAKSNNPYAFSTPHQDQ